MGGCGGGWEGLSPQSQTYRGLPAVVLGPGIQAVVSQLLLGLDLLHQPLWVGDLGDCVPALCPPRRGKPVPHAPILHGTPVLTWVRDDRDTPELRFALSKANRKSYAFQREQGHWLGDLIFFFNI